MIINNLENFLQACGCDLSDFKSSNAFTGKFQSIRSIDDKRGKRSKSFCIIQNNDNSIVVIVNDFKTGEKQTARIDDYKNNYTPKLDKKEIEKNRTLRGKKSYQERKMSLKEIKEAFFSLDKDGSNNRSNSYLNNKKVSTSPFIRWDDEDNFYIPLIDIKGGLKTYQKISPTGFKMLAKGGQKKGAFFTIGDNIKGNHILVFAEGYATAKAIHEVTGLNVVVCVDASNLYSVVEAFRKKYQNKLFIIAADNDIETEKNPKIGYNLGLKKAEECLNIDNIRVVVPDALNNKSTDWNDHLVQNRAKYIEAEFNKITALLIF